MGFLLWHVSPLVGVFVRSDIVASAFRPRTTVEVGVRGEAYSGITGVNRRRTCLLVIIAGTIRLPVNEYSPQRRVYGDIVRMHPLVAGAPFDTVVSSAVVPQVIVSIGDGYSRRGVDSAPAAQLTCVSHNVVADGRAIAAHNDDAPPSLLRRQCCWRSPN